MAKSTHLAAATLKHQRASDRPAEKSFWGSFKDMFPNLGVSLASETLIDHLIRGGPDNFLRLLRDVLFQFKSADGVHFYLASFDEAGKVQGVVPYVEIIKRGFDISVSPLKNVVTAIEEVGKLCLESGSPILILKKGDKTKILSQSEQGTSPEDLNSEDLGRMTLAIPIKSSDGKYAKEYGFLVIQGVNLKVKHYPFLGGIFKYSKTIRAVAYSLIAQTLDRPTGLTSKETFREAISAAVEDFLKTGVNYSLILMDLDDFRKINEQHGHLGGDQALKYAAGALLSTVRTSQRASDIAARNGGDELGALIRVDNQPSAILTGVGIAKRFRAALRKTANGIKVTCSIGVCDMTYAKLNLEFRGAPINVEGLTEEIIRLADESAKHVKTNGKNGIGYVQPTPEGTRYFLFERGNQ